MLGGRDRPQPNKHETFSQCWHNVEPSFTTLAQHCSNIGWKSRVSWEWLEGIGIQAGHATRWTNAGSMLGRRGSYHQQNYNVVK